MTEPLQSSSARDRIAEGSHTFERPCSLGFSDVTPDAVAYCLRHGLWQSLLLALALIYHYFSGVNACHLRLEELGTGEEWLVLELTLQEDVDAVLASCDAYTDRWVAQVPWPECNQIQLVYNVL